MGKLGKGTHKIYGVKRGGKRNEGHYNETLLYVKIETRRLVSSGWKKYIKYSVYHMTDLANEIVRKPHHM